MALESGRKGLSSVYGFIVIFTLLMAGIGAALTITDSQAAIWNAQDRARQVQAGQRAEHLTLSLNGTSLTVRNDGLIPSSLAYLYQKGASTSTDRRIGSSLQEGSNLTIPVTGGMLSFAVITSLGNVFWVNNSTLSQSQTTTVPVTFDAYGLSLSYASATLVTVDGVPYSYSSLPKTFGWAAGSVHSYSYAQSFTTGAGQRVGWSYARGISSSIAGMVKASQPGGVVSYYSQQYLLSVAGGDGIRFIGSPTNDGWYDSGSTAAATTNYVWSVVVGQSRLNLVSWNLDGGGNTAVARAGSGTFTTTSITMNGAHTVNFNSATQYYVATANSVSPGSVSIPGSYGYYTSGFNCGGFTAGSTTWGGTVSVSGTTKTYSYSVGIGWPNDSCPSQQWTASSGGLSSTTCTSYTFSGGVMTSAHGQGCTITITASASYSANAVGQTSDGWFDSGVAGSITASGNITFSSWSVPAGITIAASTSASTTITASTYGTITANWAAS